MSETKQQIKSMIEDNDIFLFMKGTPTTPMCGFSFRVASLLMNEGIDFASFNVLEDLDVRQGIKDFSNWPTIPQLYVKGEFIGGCDIVEELYETGELMKILKD